MPTGLLQPLLPVVTARLLPSLLRLPLLRLHPLLPRRLPLLPLRPSLLLLLLRLQHLWLPR